MPLVYSAMRYLLLCILLCTTTLSTVSITHVLLLGTNGYIEGLLHHLAMLYAYTEVEGYYSLDHG